MARTVPHALFRTLAEDQFAFLADEGFVELSFSDGVSGCAISYQSHSFRVSVSLADRQAEVDTGVSARGPRQASAGTDCLYAAAALGPANVITHAARSEHSATKALASQATALREVLPLLRERGGLLDDCRGH